MSFGANGMEKMPKYDYICDCGHEKTIEVSYVDWGKKKAMGELVMVVCEKCGREMRKTFQPTPAIWKTGK